jgi:hypothetical protein
MPKWFDVFIPPGRRGEGKYKLGANVDANFEEMEENARLEMARKAGRDVDSIRGQGQRVDNDLELTPSEEANSASKVEATNAAPMNEKVVT